MKYLYNEADYRLMMPIPGETSVPGESDVPHIPHGNNNSLQGTYKAPSEAAQLAWLKRDLLNDGISEGKLKKFVELSEAVNGGGGGGGSLEFVEYTFNELPEQPDWSKLWDITDIPILNEPSIGGDIYISLVASRDITEFNNSINLIRLYQEKKRWVSYVDNFTAYILAPSQPFGLPSVISTLRSLGDSDTITDVFYNGPDDYNYYKNVVKESMKFVFIK